MIKKKWFVKHFYKGNIPNHTEYKVMLLTYKAFNDIAKAYLADLLSIISAPNHFAQLMQAYC